MNSRIQPSDVLPAFTAGDPAITLVVPCKTGGYIIGRGRTLSHLDWDTQKVTVLHEVEKGSNHRFNDGKCDASGRLWAGWYPF